MRLELDLFDEHVVRIRESGKEWGIGFGIPNKISVDVEPGKKYEMEVRIFDSDGKIKDIWTRTFAYRS